MGILIELLIGLLSIASGSLVINSDFSKALKLLFERTGIIPQGNRSSLH
jgi:hypothetical protein